MTTFDADAVRAELERFYDATRSVELVGEDPFDLGPDLDSLTATGVLATLEPIVGVGELPLKLIRRGGYTGREDFVSSLLAELTRYVASLG
ncbi:hypothetical protein HDG34_004989 [Paraburkholderia sp. HC6.4b]|uniref:hypothetical protein n=1 Tax=unclassified Paraburkholderia TaxID=2615204 RepID=UPI00161A0202|nr:MULTISPECIES: hypothetical protein [unclassified Paraburkholderia]MBB5411032.1 hypothetical protein [Paraburkholderia sp. HC6.4b]MBB5455148.1 hypothetical protein [Paraburkholderia sp. Kb1A]